MYHFQYVSRKEIAPLKKQVIELLGLVQDEIREDFTFQYEFIGTAIIDVSVPICYWEIVNCLITIQKRIPFC